jgi:DNA polymerase-3 subunit delta'
MTKLSELRGQEIALRQLRKALKSGRLSHAYLFSGPEGVGKRTAALGFAAALNCAGEEPDGCGVCPSCLKIAHSCHPDVQVVEPSGSSLKIDQIRGLQKNVNLSPMEGRYKVAVVNDADRLTVAAANSILKVLEEPPGQTVFVLITANEPAISATVVSRCRRIVFRPLSREVLRGMLSGLAPEDRLETAISLADGSVSRARLLLEESPAAGWEWADNLLRGVRDNDLLPLYRLLAEGDLNQNTVSEVLQYMLAFWRDDLIRGLGAAAGPDHCGSGRDWTGPGPLPGERIIEEILAAQKLIRQNVNIPLTLEVMIINMREIIHGGMA